MIPDGRKLNNSARYSIQFLMINNRVTSWIVVDASAFLASELLILWDEIGSNTLDTVTSMAGLHEVLLGEVALVHIEALPGSCNPDVVVLPYYADERGGYGLSACWQTICMGAKLGRLSCLMY